MTIQPYFNSNPNAWAKKVRPIGDLANQADDLPIILRHGHKSRDEFFGFFGFFAIRLASEIWRLISLGVP
jgi:hypothetical protein